MREWEQRHRWRKDQRGIAMFWVVVALASVAVTGLTVHYIASSDRVIADNFDMEARGLYAAEQATAEYMATWGVADEFEIETSKITSEEDPGEPVDPDADDDAVDPDAIVDQLGTELEPKTFTNGPISVVVTPRKVTESTRGDTWLFEAAAVVPDKRGNRPNAERTVRTFGRFRAPFNPMGAFAAPNGIDVVEDSDHFHVDGGKVGKCGDSGVPPMAVPFGEDDIRIKAHIKGEDDFDEIDDSYDDYQELVDSLDVPWAKLRNAVINGTVPVSALDPDLATIDFKSQFPKGKKDSRVWPLILIRDTLTITSDIKGWGLLMVDGPILLLDGKLDWKGVILTGKQIEVYDAHLHAKGIVVTGLTCTPAELAAGTCRNKLDGKHLGVKYNQCEVETAWMQAMVIRAVPGVRHTRMY